VNARDDRRISLLVLLALGLSLGLLCLARYQPHTFLFRDGAFVAQANRAIAQGLTLRQEAFQPHSWYEGKLPWYRDLDDAWSNLSVGADGEWYPKHSYLMPLLSTPLYLLLGPPGLLVFNWLALTLGLWAGFTLASRFTPPRLAALATLLVAAAPQVQGLAYAYSNDVLCGALVAGGLAWLAAGWPAWGGLTLGLALFAKLTHAAWVVPAALALTWGQWRALGRAALAGAAPLLAYAAANTWMYGAPWLTSYHRILTVSGGQPGVTSYSGFFDVPLWEGLKRTFSPAQEDGLWQQALLPALAWLGLIPLARPRDGAQRGPARALAAGLALGLAATVVVYSTYHYGGARFFMPVLMVSPLPLAALLGVMVEGAGTVADAWRRAWHAMPLRGVTAVRRVAWGAAALVAAGSLGTAWALRGPSGSPSLTRDLERLKVFLDEVPCDYFNLAHHKWECSRVEPGEGEFLVGRALGEQCAFGGQPMLWAPPNPQGHTRRLFWRPDRAGQGLWVRYGLDSASMGALVRFKVRAEGLEPLEMQAWTPGRLDEAVLAGPVAAGTLVEVTLPPALRSDVRLCLNVGLLP
jgi:hypothetical protein